MPARKQRPRGDSPEDPGRPLIEPCRPELMADASRPENDLERVDGDDGDQGDHPAGAAKRPSGVAAWLRWACDPA